MPVKRRGLATVFGLVLLAFLVLLGSGTYAQEQTAEDKDERTLQIELKGQIYAETTDFGAGLDRTGARTDIHFQRMRLTATGMLDQKFGFKFQTCGACGTTKQGSLGYGVTAQDVDANDRDIRIIDAYAIANFSSAFNLKVGLTKLPLTRANLDDCFAPLTLDRSMFVYTAYGTSPAKFSRDFGAVAWGGNGNDRVRYFAGIFQGREGLTKMAHPFSGATVTSSIEPTNAFEYVGRVHYDVDFGAGVRAGDGLSDGFGREEELAVHAYRSPSSSPSRFRLHSSGAISRVRYAAACPRGPDPGSPAQ